MTHYLSITLLNADCFRFSQFSHSRGTPDAHCSNKGGSPQTVVDSTPTIAEKPYISYSNGKYFLMIPQVETNKKGASANWGDNDKAIDFSKVYVVQPTDSAAAVNAKLMETKYIVISPGMYNWTEPIKITESDSVILGLGIPSLISSAGNVVIEVDSGIDGVRIAGLLLEAGAVKTETLLSVGTRNDRLFGGYQYDKC